VIASATAPAFSRNKTKVPSLQRLLARFGTDGFHALVAGIAIRQQLTVVGSKSSRLLRELRQKALKRARLAAALAKACDYPDPHEAYLAGLLLDLGQIALAVQKPALDGGIQADAAAGDSVHRAALEERAEAYTHLAAETIRGWGLESFLSDAVLFHQEAADVLADAHPLIRIVQVAERLATAASKPTEAIQEATQLLGMPAEQIRVLTVRATAQASNLMFEMDTDAARDDAPFDHGQDRLARSIADEALMANMRTLWSNSESEDQVLLAAEQCFALFFDIRRVVYCARSGDRLSGKSPSATYSRVQGLSCRLDDSTSLISRAALTGRPVDSFREKTLGGAALIDRQVARILACDEIICLPVQSSGEAIGTFVLGIDPSRYPRLVRELGLFTRLSDEAALAVVSARRRQHVVSQSQETARLDFEARVRRAAHEVSTPFGVIRNYIAVISAKTEQEQEIAEELATIVKEVERADNIISELSRRSRRPAGDEPLHLNHLVVDLVKTLRGTLLKSSTIEVGLQLDDDIPLLALDQQAVRQVLINLIRNAAEAMREGGGQLRITTENMVLFEGNEYIALSVSDTGPGIPARIVVRLFDPVTSTKGGDHQGLGLNIAKELAERLGARISCRSKAGIGTTFSVLLPRQVTQAPP